MIKKPDDIKSLDEKIATFKKQEQIEQAENQNNTEYSSAAAGFQISTELLAGVLIGVAIGYVFDKMFNTTPWLLVIFTIFGGAAGLLNIYKTFKAENRTNEE